MTDIAIKVEGIGKKYRIGQKKSGELRETFGNFFRSFKPTANSQQPTANKEFWALKDISFEVKQGEAVGIIGRNGAGKSTLLKILSRITKPTTGRFEINGRVSSLLEVGTGFHPELTGRENIYLNGTILGMKRREIKSKFDEIVAFSGVEEFIDTPVKHYSSGMKVRLAFSVAAHLEPEILIIDEVLAVGDAEFQKKCLGKMEDVTGAGRTVLFVSHNMGAVRSLCKSAIVLKNGHIYYHDYTSRAISKYLDTNYIGVEREFVPVYSKEKELKVLNVIIMDSSKNPVQNIDAGQDWFIKINVEIFGRLKHFIFALGIVTIEDRPIRTIYSEPIEIEAGNYELTFTINDVYLASDKYKLILGFSEREIAMLSICDLFIIEILDNINKAQFHRSGSKNGFVINKGNTSYRMI